tara:strand:+ start:702 stop:809 length:108 start_codon:yes stop_codon:yes gene_type:complete
MLEIQEYKYLDTTYEMKYGHNIIVDNIHDDKEQQK